MTTSIQAPSRTMKALRIVEPGRPVIADLDVPEPGLGQVLVKVLGVTTCPHWDMHILGGEPMFPGSTIEYPYPPGQPGHEAIGEVVGVGGDVQGLTVGERIACWRDAGHHRPGCYAQYVVVDAANLLAIPEDARPQAYAPLELAMCVRVSFQQLERISHVKGARVGVAGLGPAGLIAVQLAKASGASEVIGIDPVPGRRELALKMGADRAVDPADAGGLASGRGPRDNHALDLAVDCTGLKVSIEYLMDRTRHAVAIFGVVREDIRFGPEHSRGLMLVGYAGHNVEAAREALALIEAGQLDLTPLVTHTLPLSRYEEGIELLKQKKAIKVCFLPWG